MARVKDILDRRVFTNDGPVVRQLEATICELVDVPYCIAVSNGTQALELSLQAMQLKGEVIVPSLTFIATVSAIVRSGLTPVFCDVDPDTGLLSTQHLSRLISRETAAVLPVNLFGNVCRIDDICEITFPAGVPVLFDSAQAFAAKYKDVRCGGFGNAETFSLHATKFINGFEGGLITTRNHQLAAKLQKLRNFGFNDEDELEEIGTNAKLSEIHAAMALANLEQLDEILAVNHRNLETYKALLPHPFKILEASLNPGSNHQYIPVLAPPGIRDAVVDCLRADGIAARKYFSPCHLMTPYRNPPVILPATEALAMRLFCLPTGELVGSETIEKICGDLEKALSRVL